MDEDCGLGQTLIEPFSLESLSENTPAGQRCHDLNGSDSKLCFEKWHVLVQKHVQMGNILQKLIVALHRPLKEIGIICLNSDLRL